MKKTSILIMIATVVAKIFGFLREKILSSVVGTGAAASAFLYSFSLPQQFFSVVVAAFVTGFIPMFTRIELEEGTERAEQFTSNILNVMLVIGAIFSSIMFLFTRGTIGLLLPNVTDNQLIYLIPFVKVTAFTIIFTCIIQMMTGFLQIKGSFLLVALLSLPLNFIVILTIYLSNTFGLHVLPYGVFLGYAVQTCIILGYAYIKGFRYKFTFNLKDPKLQKMLLVALPLVISSASMTIGGFINNGIVSGNDNGIAFLTYAVRIGSMVEGIFGVAIITVMYPSLSRAISLQRFDDARKEFLDAVISELLFILPCSIGLFALAGPIAQFIYLGGETTLEMTQMIGSVLSFYALGIVFFSLHNLMVRVFYSYQDMKTPMYISILIIVVQISLNFFLYKLLGIPGITLGQAIAYFIGIIIEFILVVKKLKGIDTKYFFAELVKVLIANGIMFGIIFATGIIVSGRVSNTLYILIAIFIAVITYLISVLMLHVETFDDLISSLRQKIRG